MRVKDLIATMALSLNIFKELLDHDFNLKKISVMGKFKSFYAYCWSMFHMFCLTRHYAAGIWGGKNHKTDLDQKNKS